MSNIDVEIVEVGPRDGLQNLDVVMPTADKCRWIAAEHAAGVREIEVGSFVPPKLLPQMADTAGYANPAQVRRLFERVRAIAGDKLKGGHFHDTRGLGLANVMAALETGIRSFDATLGGLGGCPFAPGATGNVSTEDVVFMLE